MDVAMIPYYQHSTTFDSAAASDIIEASIARSSCSTHPGHGMSLMNVKLLVEII